MDAHPAAFRKNVVGFSATSGYQHVPDIFRKGDIDEMVRMHMANFPPSPAIFRASKPVRSRYDSRTALQSTFYRFIGSRNSHAYLRQGRNSILHAIILCAKTCDTVVAGCASLWL